MSISGPQDSKNDKKIALNKKRSKNSLSRQISGTIQPKQTNNVSIYYESAQFRTSGTGENAQLIKAENSKSSFSGRQEKTESIYQNIRAANIQVSPNRVRVSQARQNKKKNISSGKKAVYRIFALLLKRQSRSVIVASAIFVILLLSSFAAIDKNLDVIFSPYVRTLELESIRYESKNEVFDDYESDRTVTLVDADLDPVVKTVCAMTVGEFLDDNGILLGEKDSINHNLFDIVEDGMYINISRTNYSFVEREITIPHEKTTLEVQTVPRGKTKVISKGADGLATEQIRLTYVNGVLTGEETVGTKVVTKPQKEVVHVGTGGIFTAPNGKTYNYSHYIDVGATAYGDIWEGSNPAWTGRTATGVKVRKGVVAVDPKVIPLGTNMYVTGSYGDFGVCLAADVGGAVKGNLIDIYMDTIAEMYAFGRRSMRVYVLEDKLITLDSWK